MGKEKVKYIIQVEDLGDSCRVILDGSLEQIANGLFSALQDMLGQCEKGEARMLIDAMHEQLVDLIETDEEQEGENG